jgi:hypothetical protein
MPSFASLAKPNAYAEYGDSDWSKDIAVEEEPGKAAEDGVLWSAEDVDERMIDIRTLLSGALNRG